MKENYDDTSVLLVALFDKSASDGAAAGVEPACMYMTSRLSEENTKHRVNELATMANHFHFHNLQKKL